ncbi:DoxX family protein [Qipengyuania sp. CAU 1752]
MIRTGLRWLLATIYLIAGIMHLQTPESFLAIMPPWVPRPVLVVELTGWAEILGAVALAQPFSWSLRRAGAIGLAVYAVCVFPANIHHFALDMARDDGGMGWAYHGPRMVAQPLVVWLALWVGEVLDWPFPRQVSQT